MRYLPLEREYVLESTRCDRCAGSGRYGSGLRQCHNCRGLGRKVSLAGRELFYEIAELLGKPVLTRESRIPVKHFERVLAKQLRTGMRAARIRYSRVPVFREILRAELVGGSMRITFTDGAIEVPGSLETYDRELTETELNQVAMLMAARLGRGAEPRRD